MSALVHHNDRWPQLALTVQGRKRLIRRVTRALTAATGVWETEHHGADFYAILQKCRQRRDAGHGG